MRFFYVHNKLCKDLESKDSKTMPSLQGPGGRTFHPPSLSFSLSSSPSSEMSPLPTLVPITQKSFLIALFQHIIHQQVLWLSVSCNLQLEASLFSQSLFLRPKFKSLLDYSNGIKIDPPAFLSFEQSKTIAIYAALWILNPSLLHLAATLFGSRHTLRAS